MKCRDMDKYLFHQGTNFRSYEYLGCNLAECGDSYIYTFRTWAPNADEVMLISSFSGWDKPIPLKKVSEGGIYELEYQADRNLNCEAYKFRIRKGNRIFDKGDPYARFSKGGADGSSLIFCSDNFPWEDEGYLNYRKDAVSSRSGSYIAAPMNIYEMHLGSFLRNDDGSYLSYRALADILPTYIKKMGYTHVEFLPIQEHPFDGSWGYQVCGFYAPTSRFGNPDDFRHLINSLHKAGIGVIMDWVPAHFPKDAWGLYEFDGTPLYEYQGKDRQESRSWGTRFFDLGREEVQSFLVSNALYFLREFHIDGLRVDAVASMIYLDYDREPGEWVPNSKGGRENLEAIAFIKKLNAAVLGEFPDALMIAEESSAFGGVTAPISVGGMGFSLKWNMGFANDFYDYVQTDPIFRKYKHTALNFPIAYAFKENYCLPISHDEVVHGKKSFIDKMFGDLDAKFEQARVAMMAYMTYPGKKLLFMGTEYAQFREWDYASSLEWFMLDYPKHKAFSDYVAALNNFYLEQSPLWEIDFKEDGFIWLLPDENEKNLVAFKRRDLSGNELYVMLNFSGALQSCEIDACGYKLTSLFDTGNIPPESKDYIIPKANKKQKCGRVEISLPAFSGIIFKSVSKNTKINVKKDKERKNVR